MLKLRLQALLGGLAVYMSWAMANPDLQMKYKFSGNLLPVPAMNINHHIDRLHDLGRRIFMSPLLGFRMSNNDAAPISTDIKNTLHENSETSITKVTTEDTVIDFSTLTTLEDNFSEVTTEMDTTTNLWTTTEDYDDDIENRLAASPQAIASLLG